MQYLRMFAMDEVPRGRRGRRHVARLRSRHGRTACSRTRSPPSSPRDDHSHGENPRDSTRLVEIEQNILAKNQMFADENRARWSELGLLMLEPRLQPRSRQNLASCENSGNAS